MNSLFINTLSAGLTSCGGGEEGGGGSWWIILIYVALFAALYFFLIRPNSKKKKAEEEMRKNIDVGDDVTTIGGIVGKIIAVKDEEDAFIIETGSDRVKMKFKKWAISSVDTDKGPTDKKLSLQEAKEARKKAKEEKAAAKAKAKEEKANNQ